MSEPTEITTSSGQVVPLKLSIHYISFSAHSDFQQTSGFLDIMMPPHVVQYILTWTMVVILSLTYYPLADSRSWRCQRNGTFEIGSGKPVRRKEDWNFDTQELSNCIFEVLRWEEGEGTAVSLPSPIHLLIFSWKYIGGGTTCNARGKRRSSRIWASCEKGLQSSHNVSRGSERLYPDNNIRHFSTTECSLPSALLCS